MSRSPSRSRWTGPPLVVLAGIVLVAGAIAVAFLAAGSDDAPAAGDDTATPSGDAEDFGPAPELDGHIVAISPGHAEAVSQEATLPTSGGIPGAICAEIEFGETNGVWYRMAVDGEEVTESTVWTVSSREDPENGRLCYDPAEGLEPGMVEAAVSVQDPNSNAPPSEIVSWRFEVTE